MAEQLRRRVPGGIGTYAAALLGALSEASPAPEVTVVASPFPPGRGADPLERFGFPVETVGGLFTALGRWRRLEHAPSQLVTRLWDGGRLAIGSYDLVHSVSLMAPPTAAAPLTLTVHDLAWRRLPEAYPRRGVAWHEAALLRAGASASGVIVPSRVVADELLVASVGLDARRVEVIAEGCDHLPSPDREGARRLLERLGVRGEYLLTVSTLEPRKNLARLLEAYRRLRGDLPEPWPLLVVGPAGWGTVPRPPDGAILVGSVSGGVLASLYAAARVAVYVPLAEGFGLPAVEALAAGAPLVASSAVPSIVEHDSPAVLVDASSTEEIRRAVAALATDDSARADLSRAGAESVRGRTWACAAKHHLEWWDALGGGVD